ncbi:Potassium/sodium hyperpolarization-activated cyclic nucleotide-gated channel 2 [Dufourea novaeangliae]|uniref:Potassium/sodium hyperpolarization-activated cyclic nucleotide-gated channel 2 n=1 Tax=Dufourea novaeangliae TaxID=178035 RepID=A0A154P6J3_DUFNO|nr:Potassium/sodium hyperpolarization-activated cyclic nucleotide-gated channel 2 [Dufourea novaeangliae]
MDLMAYVPHFSEAPNVESTPVIQHVCEQPSEEDEVENVMPGNSIGARLQRWFLRKRILSRKHHLTHWSLKSTTAVNYEISRHVKSHPYMIHPFSSFCIFWELFMTLFTIVALLITPVSITFYFNHQGDWHLLNDVMNIVFFCDIIVWFFTGYYDYRTKVIVLDPRIVALKYLRKYFLVDVLTAPPIGLIQMVMPNMTWFCTTLNMMKFLRIRNITVYSHRLHGVYRIKYQLHKILDTSLIVFMTIHWASCLEYYVPMSVNYLGTLTQFSDLLTTFHITIKRNLKIVQQLQEYMRYKELPQALQRRLLEYYHYRNKKRFERDKKIIEEVSPCLREELILHNYLRLISNVKLFEYLPESVVAQLASSVRSEIYMPGDKIVKAGTRGESLYFITSGTVAIYTSTGKEICHLEDGSYFGEIALVMETELRIATVIAVETCEICVLDRGDFRRYISRYPDLLNRLQNVALQNLENSPILGKTHDLHTSPRHQYINISSIKRMKKTDRDRGEL